ncbi:ATP-binding protein [Radicibacter daui]|uniref:ATP-binding protein n=1 Tax=Radicibacter daui TaxID=3064829 RepID=UPI004046E46E
METASTALWTFSGLTVALGIMLASLCGVFAAIVLLRSALHHAPQALLNWVTAAALALGIVIAMETTVPIAPGIIADPRCALLALAAPVAGWPGMLLSLTASLTLRYHLGGAGMYAGMTGSILSTAAGYIVWRLCRRQGTELTLANLTALAVAAAVAGIVTIPLLPQPYARDLMTTLGPALALTNGLGVMILGGLLGLDQRLRRTELQARQAARSRSEFLASISHEMRTPLTTILGYARVMREASLLPGQASSLQQINRAAQHLLTMIDDVLDFNQLNDGKLKPEPVAIYLPDFVRDVAALCEPLAAAKALQFRTGQVDEVWLRADRRRLRQVLFNLIENAIKYTPIGTVTLSAAAEPEWLLTGGTPRTAQLCLSVTDTGIGIASEQLEEILAPAGPDQAAIARAVSSGRIGLALARALVQAMQGTLCAHSAPGQGTEITVSLKLPLLTGTQIPLPLPQEPAQAAATQHCRVLLAEDSEINRHLIETILRRAGHEVQSVTNGEEAVRAVAAQGPFTVILMDLQMPVMDGLAATRAIRQLERERGWHQRTLALTATATSEARSSYYDVQGDGLLTKPIDWELLLGFLARLAQDPEAALEQA